MPQGLKITMALGAIGFAAYLGTTIVRNYPVIVMVAILAALAVLVIAAIVAHIRNPEPKIGRIGPNAGICPKCGGKLSRGPLNGSDSLILIDPAPQAWLDESLRSMLGYVWACGNCMWTDRREGQGPANLWGRESLDTQTMRENRAASGD